MGGIRRERWPGHDPLWPGHDPLLGPPAADRSVSLIEEVYGAHFDRLCALSSAITLDRSIGAEIVHDAFAGLAGRINSVEDPVAYLQRSVVNLSIRAIRRRDRLRRAPKVTVRHHVSVEIDEMWDVVCGLPARQRAVVVLRFWEDLSYERIAAVLQMPLGTVQSTLHRALTRLREEIR